MENIKASTVFQVQWFANSENYNAAASVISQGKRVFQQVNDSFRRDTVLADTIPMLRISHNARIKTKSLVGIGVNTFSIGGIGTRCTASTNARTRFRNRNAFGTYLFETKGVILTVAFSEELKFLSALRTARLYLQGEKPIRSFYSPLIRTPRCRCLPMTFIHSYFA